MAEGLIHSRKNDHIRINLEENVESFLTTGFEKFRFIHSAFPEISLEEVSTRQVLFGRVIGLPILVSSMTGGTDQAGMINRILAEGAQQYKIAMGVGSQRAALENPALAESFRVRKYAPDILLFANLGAVQLNYGYTSEHCKRAVDMIEADALILHLNPLQEAVQPEGDTDFSGLLKKVETVCRALEAPVVIKEVGWGISGEIARQLFEAGVSAIDVAGAGGTSWSQVERFRTSDPVGIQVAESFLDWGIPTAESLLSIRKILPADFPVIASGGLKTGMDLAKAVASGANLAGLAGVFLKAAADSLDAYLELLEVFQRVLRIAMFSTGSENIDAFQKGKIIY